MLVIWGCHGKYPNTRWLEQKFVTLIWWGNKLWIKVRDSRFLYMVLIVNLLQASLIVVRALETYVSTWLMPHNSNSKSFLTGLAFNVSLFPSTCIFTEVVPWVSSPFSVFLYYSSGLQIGSTLSLPCCPKSKDHFQIRSRSMVRFGCMFLHQCSSQCRYIAYKVKFRWVRNNIYNFLVNNLSCKNRYVV